MKWAISICVLLVGCGTFKLEYLPPKKPVKQYHHTQKHNTTNKKKQVSPTPTPSPLKTYPLELEPTGSPTPTIPPNGISALMNYYETTV